MKATVKLRIKKLADGNGSYYLDWFQNGKRHYEYLKLYTVLSDRPTKDEREANRKSLKFAQQIRNQRENQLIAEPQGITPVHKRKQSVLAYLEANSSTKGGELMTEHFRRFLGGRDFQIQNLTKGHLQNFSDYLTENLNGNTANNYFSKLRTTIKRAIAEKIVPADLLLDVEAPKKQETFVNYLTTDEISQIAQSSLNPKVKQVFLFSCFCGMRYFDIKTSLGAILQTILSCDFPNRKRKQARASKQA
jgi:integrase